MRLIKYCKISIYIAHTLPIVDYDEGILSVLKPGFHSAVQQAEQAHVATMDAGRPWWRKRTILVLRPAAALRRVDRLSSANKLREATRLLSRLARFRVPAAQLRLARAYLEGVAVPGSRQDAILWCEMAARAGLVEAQCLLAALHLSGPANPCTYELFPKRRPHVASDPDLECALHWATKAAAGGSADAKAILAHIHAHGPDRYQDPGKSSTLYRESAEQGSPKGAFGYGMLLMRQPAQAAMGDQAAYWIRRAADAGIPLANYICGYICEHGIGLPTDPAEAAMFYERSARRGVVRGQLRWGMLLIEGTHVGRNAVEGESWLRKAALAGEPEAANAVGDLYARELDLPPNFLEAARWYRHAAERKHGPAAFKLAQLLANNMLGLPLDLDEAVHWYCLAVEAGHQPAQAELVKLLRGGAPAAHQLRIRTWFETKARAGDPLAAFNLGLSVLLSPDVLGTDQQAMFWLRQAAETMAEAQCWYGYLLAEGRGTAAEPQAGRAWIKRAADAGLQDAKVLLAEMMLNGRGGACDHGEAFRVFKQAAEAGHAGAAFATGMMLRGGHDIAPDEAAALIWLREAARRGHAHAQQIVELLATSVTSVTA